MALANRISKNLVAAGLGALLAAGLGLFLLHFPFGLGLIHASYDLLLVARGDVATHEAVMVYLDEKSHLALDQSQTAPWDRALHARMIDRLTAAGAKAVVFDVVFSDPNPNHPDGDEALALAMKTNGRIVLAADRIPIGHKQSQVVLPFELLRDNVAAIGSAEVTPGRDLVVREHTPEEELPSLSWAAAEFLAAPPIQAATDRHQSRWINYYGPPNSIPWRSYCDALDPAQVADEFFRDKTVFIGSRIITKFAGERKDEYRNPFGFWMSRAMAEERGAMFIPGVEIQATAFLNLLRGDWLKRTSGAVESSVIILLGLLIGYGLVRLNPVPATGVAAGALGLLVGVCFVLFRQQLIWFPWLIVVVQIGVALAWSILFNSIQLYVQKKLYEHTLSLYLSPKLVKKFAGNPQLLKPGAEKQVLTLFFSDIADFTSLSEGMDSDHLAKMMNTYFETAVSQCIHKTDGTVVKYIGDAIFAFWNAPEPQPDQAVRAGEAALHFRDGGAHNINGLELRTRIGLHTGLANVGNFGSAERVDYTALGENVNLASRLEGLNKHLGTSTLMSGETKAGIGDRLVTRRLGSFRLKGFEKAVDVHELVGWPAEAETTRPWRESFEVALRHFGSGDLVAASQAFGRTLELRPGDGPAQFYLGRIESLQKDGLPNGWLGEVELKEK